jgi:hypothetical protein
MAVKLRQKKRIIHGQIQNGLVEIAAGSIQKLFSHQHLTGTYD